MSTNSDETVAISSLISNNSTSSHTNGNTVPTTTTEAIITFNWGSYLKTTDSHAAPVSYFPHVKYLFFFFLLLGGANLTPFCPHQPTQ
ncbi:unnamed protein product [Rotaria sp. Silwood1]|nr:unnamed protein product [Rotaria sp. Silwood1]